MDRQTPPWFFLGSKCGTNPRGNEVLTIATCIRRARSPCQREDHWPIGGGFYRFAVAIPSGGTTAIAYDWLVGTSICEMLNRKTEHYSGQGQVRVDSARQLYRPTSGVSKRIAQMRRVGKGPLDDRGFGAPKSHAFFGNEA